MPTDAPPSPRAFLTGAFGSVGTWLITELRELGYAVTCFDLPSQASRKQEARLRRKHDFVTIWGDITQETAVRQAVAQALPDVIVHAAAIIPPVSIRRPELAHAVNIGGTQALVAAAMAAGGVRRFVLVSSYSVHGPSNPTRDPAPWTADTPVNPGDDYGRQKVEAERLVCASTLEHVVVRLCAVFPLDNGPADPSMLRFAFLLPYDRREQAIDVRDAALAIARATIVPEAANRTFDVGGGDGWQGIGGELTGAMMQASGIPPFTRDTQRLPDPNVDESWFYENWVDTSESQRVLAYQRHGFAEFLAERRRRARWLRPLLHLLGGTIARRMAAGSPYHGKPLAPDPRPFSDVASEALRDR